MARYSQQRLSFAVAVGTIIRWLVDWWSRTVRCSVPWSGPIRPHLTQSVRSSNTCPTAQLDGRPSVAVPKTINPVRQPPRQSSLALVCIAWSPPSVDAWLRSGRGESLLLSQVIIRSFQKRSTARPVKAGDTQIAGGRIRQLPPPDGTKQILERFDRWFRSGWRAACRIGRDRGLVDQPADDYPAGHELPSRAAARLRLGTPAKAPRWPETNAHWESGECKGSRLTQVKTGRSSRPGPRQGGGRKRGPAGRQPTRHDAAQRSMATREAEHRPDRRRARAPAHLA